MFVLRVIIDTLPSVTPTPSNGQLVGIIGAIALVLTPVVGWVTVRNTRRSTIEDITREMMTDLNKSLRDDNATLRRELRRANARITELERHVRDIEGRTSP